MKLFYSIVLVCSVKPGQVFFLIEKNAFSFIFTNMNWQLIIQTIRTYSQIPCLNHFRFPQHPYVYLTGLVEYHWYIAKTMQFIVPASENSLYNVMKKALFVSKNETILLFYLKNRCTSFCLIKLHDLCCLLQSIKIISAWFPFSAPFKIMSVNRDKNISVEWFALMPDW